MFPSIISRIKLFRKKPFSCSGFYLFEKLTWKPGSPNRFSIAPRSELQPWNNATLCVRIGFPFFRLSVHFIVQNILDIYVTKQVLIAYEVPRCSLINFSYVTLITHLRKGGEDVSSPDSRKRGLMAQQKFPAAVFVLPFVNISSILLTKLYFWFQQNGNGIPSGSDVANVSGRL